MYGAVLRPTTELTNSGEADMGVLFLTNQGYSTMCGHATIALGRLLVDYAGSDREDLFPRHSIPTLKFNSNEAEVYVRLHAPCGLVLVTVPIICTNSNPLSWRYDGARKVSYNSVPSFATGLSLSIRIAAEDNSYRWAALQQSTEITVSVAYGGTFYIIVPAGALGFDASIVSIRDKHSLAILDEATEKLRRVFLESPHNMAVREMSLKHPYEARLEALYGVIVTGFSDVDTENEIGVCVSSQTSRPIAVPLVLVSRLAWHSLMQLENLASSSLVLSIVQSLQPSARVLSRAKQLQRLMPELAAPV